MARLNVASVRFTPAVVAALLFVGCAASSGGGSSSPPATPTPSAGTAVAGILNRPPGPIPMPAFATMSAPTASVVWTLMVDQYLYRSTDQGRTWEQRPIPPFVGQAPQVSFVDDREGWLATTSSPETQCNGEGVAIWHTADAGATWLQLGSNGIAGVQCKQDLSFADHLHGFISAWDDNHAPVVYRTADGGLNWAPSSPLPDPPGWTTQSGGVTLRAGTVGAFGSVLLVPAVGFLSGALVVYVFRSVDGGATWTYLATVKGGGALAIVTASRWIQLLVSPDSLETTDSGATWHRFASDYGQAAPIAPQVVFADSDIGYATVRAEIRVTTDGGLHWTYLTTPGTT